MPELFRTTIEYERRDDGTFRATEAPADHDIHGEGDDPHAAVIDYVRRVRDRDGGQASD